MKVIITTAAHADLTAIGEFIERDNPVRAASFVDELTSRCEDLADSPQRYPLLPRHAADGIRRRVYRGYLIIYRIRNDVIEVLRVVHGARDYERLLSPGEEPPP
ncbi:MAG TPA: type II toxin-antitoxin system RelE/ParE family toxin [Beijerinckiaceae bacterium]|jgi:toxin ParE1/3/4